MFNLIKLKFEDNQYWFQNPWTFIFVYKKQALPVCQKHQVALKCQVALKHQIAQKHQVARKPGCPETPGAKNFRLDLFTNLRSLTFLKLNWPLLANYGNKIQKFENHLACFTEKSLTKSHFGYVTELKFWKQNAYTISGSVILSVRRFSLPNCDVTSYEKFQFSIWSSKILQFPKCCQYGLTVL